MALRKPLPSDRAYTIAATRQLVASARRNGVNPARLLIDVGVLTDAEVEAALSDATLSKAVSRRAMAGRAA